MEMSAFSKYLYHASQCIEIIKDLHYCNIVYRYVGMGTVYNIM